MLAVETMVFDALLLESWSRPRRKAWPGDDPGTVRCQLCGEWTPEVDWDYVEGVKVCKECREAYGDELEETVEAIREKRTFLS